MTFVKATVAALAMAAAAWFTEAGSATCCRARRFPCGRLRVAASMAMALAVLVGDRLAGAVA